MPGSPGTDPVQVAVIGGDDPLIDLLVATLRDARGVVGDDLDAALRELRPSVIVYLAAARGDGDGLPDLDDAARVLAALARFPLRQVVVVSSAAVVEPAHDHPGRIDEARLPARPPGNAVSRRWRRLEAVAAEAVATATPAPVLTVLRPPPTPMRDGRDYWSRLLTRGLAVTVTGHDPTVQLLAAEDLAGAVRAAVERPAAGTFHLAPRQAIPLRRALGAAGRRRLPLPWWLHRLGRSLLTPLGLAAAADQAAYLRHPWTVSGAAAQETFDFTPRHSSFDAARRLRSGGARPDGDEPSFDDFGQDRRYIAAYGRTLFRFLHDVYWRVEYRGLEHVPRHGRAVLAGVHRGFMPWDGVMALHGLVRGVGRYPRFLVHPTLVKFPFLANYMTKLGGLLACRENADWVLERDGLLGMFPEGIQGAFSYYRDAYRLRRFGRDEYVRMALRNRAPIVPFVTVGSAEIYPIFGKLDWRWWKRFTEWPCFPITATFPLLPLPLPSKWHTRFLAPLHVEERHPPEAADDPEVVRQVSDEVRRRMEEAIAEMLARRRSIFFGSVFD